MPDDHCTPRILQGEFRIYTDGNEEETNVLS